jgi:hypothetical protein
MPQTRNHIKRGAVGPERLSDSVALGRYCFESFMAEPLVSKKGVLAAPAGTDLQAQVFWTGRHGFEYTFIGDATDAFYPVLATEGGYNWVMTTATLARGVEVNFGGELPAHPRNFVPRSEDFFARILLNVDDASGVDLIFGVRKATAAVATITEITDIAGLRILGDDSSALAALSVVTNLNNGGTSDIVSTALSGNLTDGFTVELEVRGIGGNARFYINGAQVGSGVAYTFDSGDAVSPVLRAVQTTDLAAQIKTLAFECGLIDDRRDFTLYELAGSTT